MGQPLTGTEVQATYEALLKTPNNTILVTGNTEPVTDGAGNESALHLGINQVKLKGEYVQIESQSGQSGIVADAGTPSAAEINYYGTHSFQSATVEGLPFETDYRISAVNNGGGATIDITAYPSENITSAIQILEGDNITIETVDNIMTISAAGGGGAAGLVAGTGTSSMKSADSLTTNPATASGSNSIALGSGALAENENSIAIGQNAKATSPYSIALGQVNNTYPDGTAPYISLQTSTIDMAFRENSVAIGNVAYPAYNGVAIGSDALHTGGGYYRTIVIGNTVRTNGNDDITIGNNSGGYGFGESKITIGKNINNFAEKSILIGSNLDNSDDTRVKSIIIGNSVKVAQNAIAIGNDSTEYVAADAIQIGNGGHVTHSNYGVNVGYNNTITGYAEGQIIIGKSNVSSAQRNVIIGSLNQGGADGTIMIGELSTTSPTGRNHGIGYQTITTGAGEDKMAYGTLTKATADRAVAIGRGAEATHTYSVALGPGVTSKTVDTTHVAGLNVGSVNEYADNAAAVSAGLPIGQVYRTGDLLKVVHA